MNKFLLMILIANMLMSCNQGAKQTAAINADSLSATVQKPSAKVDTAFMQVNPLSPAELKDDTVFTDGSIPTKWKLAGVKDVEGLKVFIKQLQQWTIMNDKEQLASAIRYPLNNTVKTKEDLVANYDVVFTKQVKLSFATVNFNQLFRNEHGVMTDGGKVWINQIGKTFKITAINP